MFILTWKSYNDFDITKHKTEFVTLEAARNYLRRLDSAIPFDSPNHFNDGYNIVSTDTGKKFRLMRSCNQLISFRFRTPPKT